ncbi:MAG TPA: tetratricopeptide repeat protein [Gemmataceae bacterium]|nr:tetratricopeptide repeat protein [Gemmataceae bacterium]
MRRRLNLRFFACLLGALVLSGVGVNFLHAFQVQRNAGALRKYADRAEEQGQLDKAADYLKRYLTLVPGDIDARARYGLALETVAKSPRERLSALFVFDDVLRRDPQRTEIRRKAVDLALSLRRFSDAEFHLNTLRTASPDNGELEYLSGRCEEGLGQFAKAAAWYEKAIKHAPKQIESYTHLADLWRHRLNMPRRTDALMNKLITANASAEAFLARARYYRERATQEEDTAEPLPASAAGVVAVVVSPLSPLTLTASTARLTVKSVREELLDRAGRDVAEACRLAPENPEAFLDAANLALLQNQTDAARKHAQRALHLRRREARTYNLLAGIELQSGHKDKAIDWLRAGLKELPGEGELVWTLADLLVDQKDQTEVVKLIETLRKGGTARGPVEYLEARLLLNQGKWLEASQALEGSRSLLTRWPALSKQADLLLGLCYEQLGDADRRYAAYRRAVNADPFWIPASLGLAQSLVALRKFDDALQIYDNLIPRAPGARIMVARVKILKNLDLPRPQQRWEDVEQLLDESAQILPNALEVVGLRVEMLAAQDRLKQASEVLEKARETHVDKVEWWTTRAVLAQRQKLETPLAILDEAEKKLGDRVELRLARAGYWAQQGGKEAVPALDQLARGADKFNPQDQERLLRGLAAAYARSGASALAEALWRELAQRHPDDLGLQTILFDLALQAGDTETVKRVVARLEKIEKTDGILWRYGKAAALIARAQTGDRKGLDEARRLLATVAARRPAWSRLAISQGRVEDLQGNAEGALGHYLRAIDLGERTPDVVRRTLQLLYQRQRYTDASEVLRKFTERQSLSGDLQWFAADLSLRAKDHGRALDLAQKAVAANPKDYREHIWLAQVLRAVGKQAEAEPVLRQALRLADDVPETWVALIEYLVSSGKKKEAEAELPKARNKLEAKAPLAVAQCHEMLGEQESARKLYEGNLAAKGDDVAALQVAASFYLRSKQLREAEESLRRIIQLKDKKPAEAAAARRFLAVVLMTSPRDHKQRREDLAALGFLSEGGPARQPTQEDVADRRTRALVLAAQNRRGEREQALQIMEGIAKTEPLTAGDHFFLAELYQRTGNWPKAQVHLRNWVSKEGDNPTSLAHYTHALLRHDEVEAAQSWVAKLAEKEPKSLRTAEMKARVLVRREKGDEAAALLEAHVKENDAHAGIVAILLEQLGQSKSAEKMYRQWVAASKSPETVLALAEFLGRQKRVPEALDLCAKAWETCPADRVALASLGILDAGKGADEHYQQVARSLEEAIRKNPKMTSLTRYQATLRSLRGSFQEAEKTFRQALAQNPRDATAMNNLAWLLAFQPSKGAEALELIQQALDIVGPVPAALDTRAVIYLALGRKDQAVKDLEEVVAASPTAAHYFHLAQAWHAAGKRDRALNALLEAEGRGLAESVLHPLERDAYRRLLAALGRS